MIYGTGHISIGGWFLGLTALFDVLDGMVARRANKSSTFGAFLDSTLDRVADGAVLGGLAVFYALNPVHHSVPMVVVCLAGIIGTFLTSYTRARAEALGLDAKVGMLQRPERVVLLSAPQAFFGLALNGWVLATHHHHAHGHRMDHRGAARQYVYDNTRPRAARAGRDSGRANRQPIPGATSPSVATPLARRSRENSLAG